MLHEHKIMARYCGELLGTFCLYALVLVISLRIGPPMQPGIGRTLVLLSPMAPVLLMIGVIIRGFRRMDEYLRRQALENLAIAAAITAGWTFTYGFLENAGFPRLSMFAVWPVMGWIWGGLAIVRMIIGR